MSQEFSEHQIGSHYSLENPFFSNPHLYSLFLSIYPLSSSICTPEKLP